MTDFTQMALSERGHEAKQETRERALDIVRRSSKLWARKSESLRYDWMELAGKEAPTLQMLLDEDVLKEARFIGVDRSQKVLEGCREHYGPSAPAQWVKGSLKTLLRDSASFSNVGVLVYDSFRAVKGDPIGGDLSVLSHFVRRQEKKIGEFVLVINVTQSRSSEKDIEDYRRLLADSFEMNLEDIDLHQYRSKRTPMLWTAIRLGF